MTRLSHSSPYSSILFLIGNYRSKAFLVLAMVMTMVSAGFAQQAATATSLAISATSVPYQTPIILTATVTSSSPVTAGLVLFCEATAIFCENNSALGVAQLTFPGATASVKLGSGPIGNHSYKAVFKANSSYSSSLSNTVTYGVTGTHTSNVSLTSTGIIGNYTLQGTVHGLGLLTTGPTGKISFLDTSNGNNVLGTENLVVSTLSTTFVQNQPFAIGGPAATNRSVAIASAYLDGDNNLDVVTGDSVRTVPSTDPAPPDNSTITVLLGKGDGTFKTQVNYPGCTVGSAVQILLADFNRDGNTDIALGCSDRTNANIHNGTNGGLVIILGNGNGTFRAPTFYSTGDVASIAMGDFNGDGLLDIALTDNAQQNVIFFTGNGDGTFTQDPVSIVTAAAARGVVVADLNKDGIDDVAYAVASGSLFDLYVAISNGDGTFKVPILPAATQIGEFLTAGDTNADNNTDIVAATITRPGGPPVSNIGNSLFVLQGNGNGTFKTPVAYLSDIPSDPHLADVNGDGIPDIIAGGSLGALVYQGNGDGTFVPYAAGSLPSLEPIIGGFVLTYAVNAGDFNNDGNADLIGTDADSAQAAVSLSLVAQTSTASALTSVAVFPLGSGVHFVNASYSGDGVYIGSVSTTVPLTAAPVDTSLTLTAVPTLSVLTGQSVTLTAVLSPFTVSPPTTTTNGELVNFFSGSALLGSGTLSNGVATLTTAGLVTGVDSLTAVFPGDSNYNPSTSNLIPVTVADILLTSSVNPSTYLQSVTFTATVGSGKTGTVTFLDGATAIGTASIGGPAVTFTTSSLSIGSHNITAQYNSSVSPVLVQVVNKATPTVIVTTSGPSTYGSTVTITASVPTDATGTITFTSGTLSLGLGTIVNGTVSVTTAALTPPSDLITATYNGDTHYTSAFGTVTQTVAKADSAPTLTSSLNPSLPGASVTFTDTLPSNVTGTVTFTNGATVLGTSTVTGGVATVTTSTLPLGPDPITATYNGDGNFNSSVATLTQNVAKVTPVVTVSTSGASIFGHSVTIIASVPNGPTGTITITSGGVTLGSGTITSSNGTVTITTTVLPAGPDLITATYGGDTTNNTATGTTTQTVAKASPTETLVSSLNPSNFNQSVTFTATLPTNVTGTVTFTSGTATLGTSTVTNGVATLATAALAAGNDTVTATYNGDTNNNTATASVPQTVKATPVVTLTSSTNPSAIGQSVTFTATLPSGVTGTVTFTSGSTALGTFSLTGGAATATTSSLPAGNDPITATYNGDGNNDVATGTLTQIVGKTTPTVSLISSVNPSAVNQSVTFTATVTTGATGTVSFLDGATPIGTGAVTSGIATFTTSTLTGGVHSITASYGGDTAYVPAVSAPLSQTVNKLTPVLPPPVVLTNNPPVGTPVTITETVPPGVSGPVTFSDGTTPIGTAPIIGGVATITVTNLPLGSDPITASTPGDSNNNPATSPPVTVTVVKAAPTVSVTSSLNPSIINQPVTFTATAPSNATGTITFFDGLTTLGTGTLNNGLAALTTSTLIVGSHTITVSYGGDTNNNPASSLPLTQIVNKATPVIPPPVVSSNNPPVNTPVTITETVPPGVTGTVTFSNGTTPIGTAPIVGGVATITVPSLPVGTDPITATTSGDTNNNPATSGATIVTVTPLTPVLVAPIVSSNNPAPDTPVTITEPIPPGVSGPITFFDGTTPLGTAPIVNGQATLTVPSLPIGTNQITVTATNTSTSGTITSPPTQVTVAKATIVVTLASSANPSNPNQSVTFSATVHAGATGSVTFLDGTTILGVGTINAAGVAIFTTSTLAIGSHPITASYGGDSSYSAATSAVLTQVVGRIPTVTTIVESAPAQLLHTGVTFTANVTAPSPNATGTVTFMDGTTVLGTATLSANGGVIVSLTTNANAALATTNLVTGPHQIVAVYSGDNNFLPSTSVPAANIVEDFTNTNSGPASQNVFPGATTTYNFTLAPVSATTFLNDLTVTVDGLPPGSTYTFTPSTIKAGSGSAQIVLSVQTSSSLSARNNVPQNGPSPHNELPVALGVLGLVGLGAVRKLRHKMPRTLLLIVLTLGSLLPIAALSGCAGGYFTLNPTTFSLTVTGTEGVVQHAATATLIVQ
jgi:Bacterial Ig-like domain (group 3)/FG-GAP-like repeat